MFNIWSKYENQIYLVTYFKFFNKFGQHTFFPANLEYANELQKHMCCAYSHGQAKPTCLLAPEDIFLVPNRLHIQTQDTQKHQKMASTEISPRFLGPANFWGQKNDFIASVHPLWANFWPIVMSNTKLSYFSYPSAEFDRSKQPIILGLGFCEFASHK